MRSLLLVLGLLAVAGAAWLAREAQDTQPGAVAAPREAARTDGEGAVAGPSGHGPTLSARPGGAGGAAARRAAAAARIPGPLLREGFPRDVPRTVLDADGRPVAGAEVALRWVRGDLVEEVMHVRAGPDGRWTPDWSGWEALPPVVRETGRWSFQVVAPGAAPARDVHPKTAETVRLGRGASVRGRVVDGAGAPVPRARVWFFADRRQEAQDAVTDAGGAFLFSLPPQGPYRVVAVAKAVGAARRDLQLDPRRDETLADLVLGGEGTLEGRVAYPDGAPAADVAVEAWHERTRNGYGEGNPSEAAGLGMASARTGPDGRFRIRGLLPGPCAVFVPLGYGSFPSWTLVAPTGTTDVVVPVRPVRVRVRLVDPEGRPVPGAFLACRGVLHGADGFVEGPSAVADLWTSPGWQVAVAARAGQGPWTETTLTAPYDAPEVQTTLVLRLDDGMRGSLRVRLTDGSGRPVTRAVLAVLTPGAAAWVAGSSLEAGDGSFALPSVPVGRARLRVRLGDTRRTDDVLHNYWFAEERDVEVHAGVETEVAIPGREGGRLRIETRLAEGEAAPSGATNAWLHGPPPAPPRLLQEFVELPPGKAARARNGVEVGIPAVTQDLLEEGRHTVGLSSVDGLSSAAVEVVIRAGTTTTAHFLLRR